MESYEQRVRCGCRSPGSSNGGSPCLYVVYLANRPSFPRRNFGVAAKIFLINTPTGQALNSLLYVAHKRRRPSTTTNLSQVRGEA